MTTNASQVVVAFDLSDSARAALQRGIELATRSPIHVLHVVCVIDPHAPIPGISATNGVDYQYAERVQQTITEHIESELRSADAIGRIHFYVHARIGHAAEQILATARDVGADLIIIGNHNGRGIERFVLGSVSERVVREAGCTVEVVRAKTYAHVDLLRVVEVAPHPGYIPPHRYSYENSALNLRPADWPLY